MPASRFSKVNIPRARGNSVSGEVITALGGLDMVSPLEAIQAGRTPYSKNFRLYAQAETDDDEERTVPVTTRKGAGFYTAPLNESLLTSNTSSTGASTAQVGVDTELKAQSFTAGSGGRLTRFDVNAASGTASSVLRVDIYSDSNGKPAKRLTRSSFLSVPDVAGWVTARFLNAPVLESGKTYWAVFYIQDDGAGFAQLTTSTTGVPANTSNGGIIALTPATYSILYKAYITPSAKSLGAYRFNRDDGINRTLVAYGTTLYMVDEQSGTLTPLITGLSGSATEYSFTNADGKVFWVNGVDDMMSWDGVLEQDKTNLISNGSFAVDTSGWTPKGTVTLTRDTSTFASSPASMKLTKTAAGGADISLPTTARKRYKLTAKFRGTVANQVMTLEYITAVGGTMTETLATVTCVDPNQWYTATVYVNTAFDRTALRTYSSNTASYWIDDVSLIDTGIESIVDPELPILREIAFHKGRMMGVPASERNVLRFSEEMGNPSDKPVNEQWYKAWLSVSAIPVPRVKNGSPITSITSFQDNLVITTQDMKYVLSGTDRGSYFLRESTGSKGALSRRGVIADPNYIYFVADDGIYRFNGAKDEKVSFLVQPLFDNCPRKHEIDLVLWKNDLRAYMSSRFATENDITLVMSGDLQEWMLDTDTYIDRALYYSDADDNMELVEFSSQTATAYYAETSFNALGAPIDFDYRLKYDSRGVPGQRKKYTRYVPLVQAVGKSFPITYGNDRNFEGHPREKQEQLNVGGAKIGSFFIGDGTILTGNTPFKPKRTAISGYSYYMQFRVRRDAVDNQVAFRGVQYTYKTKRL